MGNTTRKAVSLGLAATLLATVGAAIGAVPALASTSVTSAGSVLPGGTSAGTASFTLTENSVSAFANETRVERSRSRSPTARVRPRSILRAHLSSRLPGSLGATVALGSAGTSFIVTTAGADNNNIEPITVSGLRISADAGAAAGPIKAAMSGSLVGAIISPTATATGTVQTFVAAGSTAGVVVNVGSACGFAVTAGLERQRHVLRRRRPTGDNTAATALATGQQTLTIDVGASTHVVGTTITQTVADCLGTNLGSPGTVGSGSPTQHLVFTTQPGGGVPSRAWAAAAKSSPWRTRSTPSSPCDSSTVVTPSIGTNPAGRTPVLLERAGAGPGVVNGATFFGCADQRRALGERIR